MAFLAALGALLSVAGAGEVRVVDLVVEGGKAPLPPGAVARFGDGDMNGKLALSFDGRLAASAGQDGKLRIFDVAARKMTIEIQAHPGECHDTAFALDCASFFTCGDDAAVRQWDTIAGKEIRKFEGHTGEARAVVCSPDGRRMASSDGTGIRIWEIASGRQLHHLTGHKVPDIAGFVIAPGGAVAALDLTIDALRFSADGRLLLSEANDESAKLWDALTGREIRTLPNHDGTTAALALSPDGLWGASTRGGGRLRVWDVQSGQTSALIAGHAQDLTCVAFSPDSRYVLTGANDLTLRQWEVESGVEVRNWKLDSTPMSVVCSPDGKTALTSSAEGILVWDLRALPLRDRTGHFVNEPLAGAGFDWFWQALADKEYHQRLVGVHYYAKAANPAAAVADLRQRMKDAGRDKPPEYSALIDRLDDGRYEVRRAAYEELRTAGTRARRDLLKAQEHASLEVRLSAAELLGEFGGLGNAADFRPVLALEILALLDTPEAREELRRIAASPLPCAAHARALAARP